MSSERDEELYNLFGRERISQRQIDELIGLSRGLCADGMLNEAEVSFLEKWLAASAAATGNAVVTTLYRRIREIFQDGVADQEEREDLFETLNAFSDTTFETGEVLKSTTLPLCSPPPELEFVGRSYCFTGTFTFGCRSLCEQAVVKRGGVCGSLTKKTNFLVVGEYATESWKHSSFGNKIMKAAELRDQRGVPIAIVSEQHWVTFL